MSIQAQPFELTSLPLTGRHLIEASAGTGKTYSIIRIYLRLLIESELSVNEILVMTFTKAATAELRSRFAEFLAKALRDWDTSNDDVIVSLRENDTENKAPLLLRKALLQLDEASIYTIHGFCKRALSQQAFHSGTSFRADMDADTDTLKQEAAEDWYRQQQSKESFEKLYENWPTPESFVSHWRELISRNDELTLPAPIDLTPLLSAHKASWPEEQQQFRKLNKEAARSTADTLQAYSDCFHALANLASDEPTLELVQGLDKSFSTAKKKEAMANAFALADAIKRNDKIKLILLAVEGVDYIRKHVQENKDRLDQLDFDDLIHQLKDAVVKPENEELRTLLREQFKAALVDEFQDTDPDQYAIVDSIYTKNDTNFVCLIGDPKQAIYAFRGGDVFAYLKARQQADYYWTMNTNFRSSEAVVHGYNQTFLQSNSNSNDTVFGFGIDYHRVEANKDAPVFEFSDNEERSAMQWINFEPADGTNKGVTKVFQHTIAQWCVNEVIRLLTHVTRNGEHIKTKDIAFLVRKKDEAELLQSYLTDAGLPSVYLSSRTSIFESAEAQDLLLLLRGIWQFENERALTAALACSWIGLDTITLDAIKHDENLWAHWQGQFEAWRQQWLQQGLMSLLLNVLKEHFQPRSTPFDRQLTNMMQLSELLQKESSRYRMPDALLHWFEQNIENPKGGEDHELRLESDEDIIKIITMHGAKGLEYPIVFLPFISYSSSSRFKKAVYHYHDRETFDAKMSLLEESKQKQLSEEEENSESVRLLYVAMTRAVQRIYGCMANFQQFSGSSLGLTLKASKFELDKIEEALIKNNSATLITVNEPDIDTLTAPAEPSLTEVKPAVFDGDIERDWWLASFSSLTRHVGHSSHSTPDRDELETPVETPSETQLRFSMAKGAETGNLLHDTLEALDFNQLNFEDALSAIENRYKASLDDISRDDYKTWLNEVLQTPFNKLSCLGDLPLNRTLRESEFYFPMSGSLVSELSELIKKKRGDIVNLPGRQKLKGMMHGFIDLIFQQGDKFYVADYKSNYLGNRFEDYSFDAMKQSIEGSYYDVQYSIYALALHRYLSIRLHDYDPEKHFGGVYYFYLRGMSPNAQSTDGESYGVYYDPLSTKYLQALDSIFSTEQERVIS